MLVIKMHLHACQCSVHWWDVTSSHATGHARQWQLHVASLLLLLWTCSYSCMQRAAGIAPDVRTYTSLISACGFSREPRMAMQLVGDLLEKKHAVLNDSFCSHIFRRFSANCPIMS